MAKNTNPKNSDSPKEDTKRTSFILKTEISRKLNVIAAIDNVSITNLVSEALSDLIAKWEKKNGEIAFK